MQNNGEEQKKLQEQPEQSFGGKLTTNSEMLWVMNKEKQKGATAQRISNTVLCARNLLPR